MDVINGAPVATALLAATALVSLAALTAWPALKDRLALRPCGLVARGDWFTLASNAFVHADVAHLAFNAFSFWAFAPDLERRIGSTRLAALYALGLAVSSGLTWLRHRHQPRYSSLGASGAVMAVIFAAIVWAPGSSLMLLPLPVPIPAPLFAVAYLVFSALSAQRGGGGINHDAHLGGALAGLAFASLSDPAALGAALRSLSALLHGWLH